MFVKSWETSRFWNMKVSSFEISNPESLRVNIIIYLIIFIYNFKLIKQNVTQIFHHFLCDFFVIWVNLSLSKQKFLPRFVYLWFFSWRFKQWLTLRYTNWDRSVNLTHEFGQLDHLSQTSRLQNFKFQINFNQKSKNKFTSFYWESVCNSNALSIH